jgi:isopentenyl diphosphate isomerase/L-lactate dehydrogenase-like FMN-dependent dehydrogenase
VLRCILAELDLTMALSSCTTLGEIDSTLIRLL